MRRERTGRTADEAPAEPPLVVDVDGSLIGGDLLIEGIARLLSVAPLSLFALPFRLAAVMVRGRAGLKRRIAEAVRLPPDTLAWNPTVREEIAAARAAGRSVWLASASDARAVLALAETVGAAGCLASDGRTNLAGEAKAAALVARFGERGFDYIGNERRDLAVWKRARRAIGVGLGAGLARKVRALDGAAAVSVALSPWLLAFFLFLFLALAIVKRQGELRGSGRSASRGRAYLAEDVPVMAALGAASGFASVVILTLYIQSPETGERYARPEFLWLICPLLLYWLGRMALLAGRGEEGRGSKRLPDNDDPLLFALRDRTSWLTGLAVLAAFAAAL